MTVALGPRVAEFIEEKVRAGRFASQAEAIEAGVARLMLDPEPDVLDEKDLTDIRTSLDQMRRGEVTDAAKVHADMRGRFLNG